MQFASYAAFRLFVQQMFDGDDISQSDISVALLDLIIGSGEQRIYRDVRSTTMNANFAGTTTNNTIPLPFDFIEFQLGPYVNGNVVATFTPLEALTNRAALNPITTSAPVRFSFLGDTITFYPGLPDGTAITAQYYSRLADISTGLNSFFNRWPDLFLYAALAETAPFLGELPRLEIWEGKYGMIRDAVNDNERRRVSRGTKLMTRIA